MANNYIDKHVTDPKLKSLVEDVMSEVIVACEGADYVDRAVFGAIKDHDWNNAEIQAKEAILLMKGVLKKIRRMKKINVESY